MLVRPLVDADRAWARDVLREEWGSTVVARKGQLIDAVALDGLVLIADGQPTGLLTHARRGEELEVVTLQVDRPGTGGGRALMDAARAYAQDSAVRRIWLITTNDNTRALRFYQRWGLDLVQVLRNGVDASRQLKPAIPLTGQDGIPLRHELELELLLPRAGP